MKLPVIYNPQTDNTPGKYDHETRVVDGNSQCGYAMAGHVSSLLFPDMATDPAIFNYLTDLESDKPGSLGVRVRALCYRPGARLGAQIDAHSNALRLKLADAGRTDIEVVQAANGSIEDILKFLDGGAPVGFMAVFQVPSMPLIYHFETIVGYDHLPEGLMLYVHDSYGNFYPTWNQATYGKGAYAAYPESWLKERVGGSWAWYYSWRHK